MDWKYVLGLDLSDPGFDHTVLSECRARWVVSTAEPRLLEALLTLARGHGLRKARGRQRTESTHVLAAGRVLNRLEQVGETVTPAWVRTLAPAAWYAR